jgi:3-isopropylmalate dehydrogenase
MSQSSSLRLAVLAGDGVGPEITAATIEILHAAAARANLPLDLEALPIGYTSYNKWKSTLTEETIQKLRGHTGWILGPTFAGEYPKDDPIRGHPSGYLRKNFGLFANVRPVKAWPQLNPLIADLDVTVIRENTQGFYPDRNMFWGYGEFLPTADVALSVRVITKPACERFARFSLEYATALEYESIAILHKRTALPQTEGLFIGAFEELKDEFPRVKTEIVRVDTFSSSLPRDHKKYRLVATTNLFGDIASDQASGLAGGVAVAPSLNAGTEQAMAQAVHGTAPDIEGQNIANPTALALSTAMLLRWFDQKKRDQRCRDAAALIEHGIHGAMESGALTRDLGGRTSTTDFTRAVVRAIEDR